MAKSRFMTYSELIQIPDFKYNNVVKTSKTKLKAHWIDISDATTDNGGHWHLRDLQCSNCASIYSISFRFNYCPDCGARMVEDETDKEEKK